MKDIYKEILNKIVEYDNLPKFQVERAISPILSLFIADVLSELLKTNCELITLEFPLKKSDSNQSTNIDYLLYDKKKKDLIFIEIKTNKNIKVKDLKKQLEIYFKFKNKKNKQVLLKDLKSINKASKEKKKYDYLLRKVAKVPFDKVQEIKIRVPAYDL